MICTNVAVAVAIQCVMDYNWMFGSLFRSEHGSNHEVHVICGQPAAEFFARVYSGIELQNNVKWSDKSNIESRIKTYFNVTLYNMILLALLLRLHIH